MTSRVGQALLRVATTGVLLAAVLASSSLVDGAPLASSHPDPSPSVPLSLPLSLPQPPPQPLPQALPSSPASAPEPETYAERRADPRGEPVRVVITAIDVAVDLVRIGLQADGAMQVPDFGLAGWYTEGPRPGHAGPAVIVAHVDSQAGPDVFYRLGDLGPSDEIHVVYDSGDEVTFVVTSSEQTPKDRLPVESIWPTTDERLLTLITCGGEFDRSVRQYGDNVIVYASP